jgi:hypothetical protein
MKTNLFKPTAIAVLLLVTSLTSFSQNVWDGGANIPTTTSSGNVKIGQLNVANTSTTPTVKLQINEDNPFIELVDNTAETRAAIPPSGCGIRFTNYNNSIFEIKTASNPLLSQGLFLSNTSSSSNLGLSIFNNKIFLGGMAIGGAPLQGKFGDVNINANASANRFTIVNSNFNAPLLDPSYAFGVYGSALIYGPVNIGTKKYVGTTHADYHLSVDGKVIAPSFYALDPTINWADYVFDKNYKLTSLEEVESFVNANKHLPEVPSTAEVQSNGINLQEMDALLLKKVEELTLYLIEMKKEMDVLKKKNEDLENQILK